MDDGGGLGPDGEQLLEVREVAELLSTQMMILQAVGEVVAVQALEAAGERAVRTCAMFATDALHVSALNAAHPLLREQVVDLDDGVLSRLSSQQPLSESGPYGRQRDERVCHRRIAAMCRAASGASVVMLSR